jgi:RNA polymerase primary sigma factor
VLAGPRHRRHRNPGRAQGFREEDRRAGEELLDLDLPAGVGEKVNDPVRMYLREMGTVPLLTREGEVEIARRIERGQNTVLKSLSRAPLVIQEIIGMGEEWPGLALRARRRSRSPDPMLTDELVEEKRQEFCPHTEESRGTTRRSCSAGRNCRPFRAA